MLNTDPPVTGGCGPQKKCLAPPVCGFCELETGAAGHVLDPAKRALKRENAGSGGFTPHPQLHSPRIEVGKYDMGQGRDREKFENAAKAIITWGEACELYETGLCNSPEKMDFGGKEENQKKNPFHMAIQKA